MHAYGLELVRKLPLAVSGPSLQSRMKLTVVQHSVGSGWATPVPSSWDSASTLALAFGGSHYQEHPEAIFDVVKALPTSVILGCSTAGEILGTRVQDDTLVVTLVQFEKSTLRTAAVPITVDSSFAAGQSLAQALLHPELRAVFVLSEGLDVNGSQLVRGLNSVFGSDVLVSGGLAGDGARFERTWVVSGGGAVSGQATAVGLYGDSLKIGSGSKGGWEIFGPERLITRSEHNVLFELDGAPALPLYKRYLAERAAGLPATALLFPLAIREPARGEGQIVRTVLAVDESTGSLRFAGDMPEGYRAQLMHANCDRLVGGAADAALLASGQCGSPSLSIAISCVGRRLVLRDRVEEELEATLEGVAKGTLQVGFYSYGEISPLSSGRCDLHNQTMTLTTVSES